MKQLAGIHVGGLLVAAAVAAIARPVLPADPADPYYAQLAPPAARYWVYVANESSDLVSLLRFGPEGAVLEKDIPVGIMPTDIDGAHGLTVAPDGGHFYVSIAHGTPFGRLWKFETGTDLLADSLTLGLFPATIGITPDAALAFVVNFNLHGDPIPSSVSAVFLPGMVEVARIETCVKPHGSRVNREGTFAYSVCVADDQLVGISIEALQVSRRLFLAPGRERILDGPELASEPGAARCGPTWVIPSHDDQALYVACNAYGEVLEIDSETFEITRRFRSGKGPYNLAATSDGRFLLATNKGEQSVSVFDLRSGEKVARIPTTQPITHGITISSDDRYAFVSNEAIGAVRGTVDVIDLAEPRLVASVQVHHQPGGIDFWKMEPLDN
ncbi:MAG: YncE family protein [Acidimicrobiia bacterium]